MRLLASSAPVLRVLTAASIGLRTDRVSPDLKSAAGRILKETDDALKAGGEAAARIQKVYARLGPGAGAEPEVGQEGVVPAGADSTATGQQQTPQQPPAVSAAAPSGAQTDRPEPIPQPDRAGVSPFAGDCKEICSGSELGNFVVRIGKDGRFDAIAWSPSAGRFTATASPHPDGRVSATAQAGFFSISLDGQFQRPGVAPTGSGTWRSNTGFRGKWRVERAALDADSVKYLDQLAAMGN